MDPFPHVYQAAAQGRGEGLIRLSSPGVPDLASAGPKEFGGPGDRWSPETLLMAAAADCFILTFRAIAAASKLEWESLECNATGTLDKVEREIRFSQIDLDVKLLVGDESVVERALRLLEKSEKHCLISSSLRCETKVHAKVQVADIVAA
ncbi:MAG: OsmC family protein [Polyangiaceae bacterium]